MFVLGTDLSGFKLEEFIRVLDLVNRFGFGSVNDIDIENICKPLE
jgi:hypothetical protein